MELPYLEYSVQSKRQPKKDDTIILYDSNQIINFDEGDYKLKNNLVDGIMFSIIDNVFNRDILDKHFIKIKPLVISDITDDTVSQIVLKTAITNVRQIMNDDNPNSTLSGNFREITTGEDVRTIFEEGTFPKYALDEICEKDSRKLVELYCENISANYNIPEIETELRTFQNMNEYGGVKNTLTSYEFNKIINVLQNSDEFMSLGDNSQETLDVFITNIPNLRFTINGKDAIKKYCMNNNIPKDTNTTAIYKGRFENKLTRDMSEEKEDYTKQFTDKKTKRDFNLGVFDMYSLRTRLGGKIEIPFKVENNLWELYTETESKNLNDSLDRAKADIKRFNTLEKEYGSKYKKTFRLKSRKSFIYNSSIRIDLTKTKMSKKEVQRIGHNLDVGPYPTTNFMSADVISQNESYEVEIEFININGLSNTVLKNRLKNNIFTGINIIKYLNCITNERPGFTHTNLKDNVLYVYKKVIDNMMGKRHAELASKKIIRGQFSSKSIKNYYISPKVKGLEIEEIQTPDETTDPLDEKSIIKNYSVTEKADGLANMLFVYGTNKIEYDDAPYADLFDLNGYMFYITPDLNICSTYQKIPIDKYWRFNFTSKELTESSGKVYEEPSSLGLPRPDAFLFNGEYLNYDKSRDILNTFGIYDTYIYSGHDRCSYPLFNKRNLLGADLIAPVDRVSLMNKFVNNLDSIIIEYQTDSPSSITFSHTGIFCKKFYAATSSETIFDQSKKIWDMKDTFDYKLDGLIYTPTHEPVAFNSKYPKYSLSPYNTWFRNLKWKPSEELTVDLLMKFKTYESSNFNDITITKNEIRVKLDTRERYYVAEFYTTGRVGSKYRPIRFQPKKYMTDECVGLFKLTNNKVFDIEGNVVKTDTIVEVSYNPHAEDNYSKFKILRTRHDKTLQYRVLVNYQKNMFKKILKVKQLLQKPRKTHTENRFINYMERSLKKTLTLKDINRMYKTYSDIVTFKYKANFGNSTMVAESIWNSIHLPITEVAITTGTLIPTLEDSAAQKYYNPRYSFRSASLTLDLQNYHNKYIKNERLIKHTVSLLREELGHSHDINLLDLACGKGGDLYKWMTSNIKECVCFDISSDNIHNEKNGAIKRYRTLKEDGKRVPDIDFRVLDTSININETFEDLIVMFALHYFFKDKTTLNGLIDNIDQHIKSGGYFIGACYDGDIIYEKINSVDEGILHFNLVDQTLLKIERMFLADKNFSNSEDSLGMGIDVEMYSIGTKHREYLVNFDYFSDLLHERGIELVSKVNFRDILPLSIAEQKKMRLKTMNIVEKEMSNLNTLFIYKKM